MMKHLRMFEGFKEKKKRGKIHTLSGVAIVVEGRILLVKPKKYKSVDHKWSIPKGHIEGDHSLKSALKELQEETGITLHDKYNDIVYVNYRKAGVDKILDVFVYHLKKEDVQKYLEGWNIMPHNFDQKEIVLAKFFKPSVARLKIELGMVDILTQLFSS